MKYFYLLMLSCLVILSSHAVDDTEVKQQEYLKFENLKKVLKHDMLEENVSKKKKTVKKYVRKKKTENKLLYQYPQSHEFQKFMVQYWLVKEASKLEWDFKKPEYGIADHLKNLLERFGYIKQKFSLLLLNDARITHLSLPYGEDHVLFLLSLPFIRTMDLTKREISLLLMEDFLRYKKGYMDKKLWEKIDRSVLKKGFFEEKKPDLSILSKATDFLNEFAYRQGYGFQEMFEVTEEMKDRLDTKPELWNAYRNLLKKVDDLVKDNQLYKDYTKIYPSPEMQLKWLMPKKEIL